MKTALSNAASVEVIYSLIPLVHFLNMVAL